MLTALLAVPPLTAALRFPLAMSSVAAASIARTTCHCGDVSITVDLSVPPMSSSICHCSTCRKLSGGVAMATVLFPSAAVEVKSASGAALLETATSKHVRRLRCSACHSPVLATLGTERVGVPLALFDAPVPDGWSPQHHMWYSKRVIDAADGLPKFTERFGSALHESASIQ